MNSFQTVLACFIFALASTFNMVFSQTPTKNNWKEDLEIYKTSLENKHINLYHTVSKEAFNKEWDKIYDGLDSQSDFDITLKLMRLTRRINDGHTAVSLRNISTHRFPIEIKLIEGKWYVTKALKSDKQILTTTLESINGTPINIVAQKVSEIAQFVENQNSLNERTGSYLTNAEVLYYLNLINKTNEATFSFRTNTNEIIHKNLGAISNKMWEETDISKLVLSVPQIEIPKNENRDIWFAPISGTKAIYVNFEAYPSFEKMSAFGEQLVSYIQEKQLKQLIIDMRKNGGGDLYVGIVLAHALNLADTIDWENGVYVLTSNTTFSAATSNAALFKQLLNATIVGQPTGSNPNGYQDMDSFTLPNSNLVITYSKRLFRISQQANTALQPDITLHQKTDDLFTETDTLLKELIGRL